MSSFPLQNLKGSQPAITPSTQVAHLEEESANEEGYINGNVPDDIEGITEKFIVCLTRVVKDAPQAEKCCYHCGSPDHFVCDCPLLAGAQVDPPLNWREGMALRKGAQTAQGKTTMPKVPQDNQGIKHQTQTPFLNPYPFIQWYRIKNVARVRVNEGAVWLSWTMAHRWTPSCWSSSKLIL